MVIDFLPVLDTPQTIKIYDTSYDAISRPFDIESMTLQIRSSVIVPNGILPSPVDLLTYIRTERQDHEIFEIRSDLLGVGESQNIPDGIYTLELIVNYIYVKEITIVVYQELKQLTIDLLNNINYNVEIGTYDVSYVGDYSEYDVEKARLASTLLDEIERNASTKLITNVEDAMKKLRKLLTII